MISPIKYRGHGRYESYYPALSIVGVMGHELIHMASYRRRAAQEGHLVLQGGVRLQLTFRDGQLVATGGEAYVRTRPLREPAPPPSEPSGPGAFSTADPAAVEAQLQREQERIQQLLWQLRARQRSAYGQPGELPAPPRQPGGAGAVDRLERAAALLRFALQLPATQTQQALLALARHAYRAALAAGAMAQGTSVERVA